MLKWIAGLAALCASAAGTTTGTQASQTPDAAAPATAQPGPASARVLPPPTPQRLQLARDLALLAQPQELMVEAVQAGFDKGLKDDSNFADLDRAIPGFGTRLAARGRAEISRMVAASIPALQARTAQIYASELTEAELAAFLDFFRSSAGRQTIRLMVFSDASETAAEDSEITTEEMTTATQAAVRETIGKLDDDQRAALIRFSLSDAGRRARFVTPRIQEATAEWMTGVMSRFGDAVEAIAAEELAKADAAAKR